MNELEVRRHLAEHGWIRLMLFEGSVPGNTAAEAAVTGLLSVFGRSLRHPRQTGIVVPLDRQRARPRSLSAIHGLGSLPLHCDTAHWTTPARLLALCRTDHGLTSVATKLLDVRKLDLSDRDRRVAETSTFLIRSGRKSFYDTILSPLRPFVRFDPGCMEPVDRQGEEAVKTFATLSINPKVASVHLAPGEALLIDNWRVLHGRAEIKAGAETRRLIRGIAA